MKIKWHAVNCRIKRNFSHVPNGTGHSDEKLDTFRLFPSTAKTVRDECERGAYGLHFVRITVDHADVPW